MKNRFHSPCGCASRDPLPIEPNRRPRPPEVPCRPHEPPDCGTPGRLPRPPEMPFRPPESFACGMPGGYLMQRILAFGRVHRRRFCQPVCLSSLPEQAQPPYSVTDVCAGGVTQWEEIPGRRGCAVYRITVPLRVRVRDGCGHMYTVPSQWEEEISLRYEVPQAECWIGQPCFQAAVRLAGRPCPSDDRCCEIPLEGMAEGFLLAPCAWGSGCRPACPTDRPWYPQPIDPSCTCR